MPSVTKNYVQAHVWALMTLVMVPCCYGSLHENISPYLSDTVWKEAAATTAGMADTGARVSSTAHGRLLLDSATSQLAQNASDLYSGVFREAFIQFPHTDLGDYTLQPMSGSCSTGAELPAEVTDCAAKHRICCFNVSTDQVGNMRASYANSTGH